MDDIPNPFAHSVKPRFLLTLNKLHLWRMTRYERVVYLDADNLVVHNMDELFGCVGRDEHTRRTDSSTFPYCPGFR